MTNQDWDDYTREDGSPLTLPADRRPGPRLGLWIAVAVLVAGGAIAVYLAFLRPVRGPVGNTTPTSVRTPPSPPRPLGGQAEHVELPPLDQTDALARRLVQELSDTPIVKAWLKTTGLIRNFVTVAVNIDEGSSPAKFLGPLRPAGTFRIIERGGRQYIDPRSYSRYDSIADAIVTLDPSRVSGLYSTLKPRIEDAYRDLGFTNRSFDQTLQSVIVTLLRTPVPEGQPLVKRKGVRYLYVDDRFETLTAAQKQFLRMGPRNVERVDQWLRRLADALGIPPAAFSAR